MSALLDPAILPFAPLCLALCLLGLTHWFLRSGPTLGAGDPAVRRTEGRPE